jgi:hypothetical protein
LVEANQKSQCMEACWVTAGWEGGIMDLNGQTENIQYTS